MAEADAGSMALAAEVAKLRERLTLLEDKEAIRDLIYRYGYTADVERYDEFLDTLTDDVVWTASGSSTPGLAPPPETSFRGKAEALAAVSGPGHAAIANREQHIMANFIISVDGDKAEAVGHLLLTIHHWGGFAVASCRYTQMKFARTGGRWRISELTFRETGHAESARFIVESGQLAHA
jgi:ketosteroid isomerase-like protein